jgi:hypothetical protein
MSTIIPFSVAHPLLEAFGITTRTRAYERWEKANGFLLEDFGEVLGPDSPRIFHIDWRDTVVDALKGFDRALASLGYKLEFTAVEDESGASFRISNGNWHEVHYSPNGDDGNYALIARSFSFSLPEELELRAGRGNEGSDSGSYALLTRTTWKEIVQMDKSVVDHFFTQLI